MFFKYQVRADSSAPHGTSVTPVSGKAEQNAKLIESLVSKGALLVTSPLHMTVYCPGGEKFEKTDAYFLTSDTNVVVGQEPKPTPRP